MFHCARKQKKTQSAYGLSYRKNPVASYMKKSQILFLGLVVFFRVIYFDDIQFLMFVLFCLVVFISFVFFKLLRKHK